MCLCSDPLGELPWRIILFCKGDRLLTDTLTNEIYTFKDDQRFYLRCLFPVLNNEYIEIRPIHKGRGDNKNRSFLSTIEGAIHAAGQIPLDRDIYVGLSTRKEKSGKNEHCKTRHVIGLDYDPAKGNEIERKDVLNKYDEIGIRPAMTVFSGHGLHVYVAIEACQDPELIVAITRKIAEKTGADTQAMTWAQVLRLPGTWNHKNGESLPVELDLQGCDPEKRYSLNELKEILDIKTDERKPAYSTETMADWPCINAMLQGVPEGHRNFTLGRIVRYLRLKTYTKKQAYDAVLEWNRRCSPPESIAQVQAAFNGYWHNNYTLLNCSMKDMRQQQILSHYCDQEACSINDNGELIFDNMVEMNNAEVFRDYKNKTGYDLIILGVILRYPEGLSTQQLIEKFIIPGKVNPSISTPTIRKSLRKLKAWGLIKTVKGSRRKGEYDFHRAILKGTFGRRYTLVSNGAIDGAINRRISPAALKLYILLLSYRFSFTGRAVYPSEQTLANWMRVDQSRINQLKKELAGGGYMRTEVINEQRKYFLLK